MIKRPFFVIFALFEIICRLVLSGLLSSSDFIDAIGNRKLAKYVTPSVIISFTASCISLIVIIFLNIIYQLAAVKLTEIELPRTQQEFDDSYSLKVFCFQFVNYYSTLFYIAFFKDTLTGYPDKPNEIVIGDGRYRWAGCDGGCSYELAIQLIVTMVGKQHYNNCLEIFMPWLIKMYKTWSTLVRNLTSLGMGGQTSPPRFSK